MLVSRSYWTFKPGSAAALRKLRFLERQKRFQDAQAYLDKLQREQPYLHWTSVGIIHLERGRFAEAENAFQQAIKDSPDVADGYFYLADTKQFQKDFRSALEYLLLRNETSHHAPS